MHTFTELEELVITWSKARKIIPNSTPLTQLVKAVSEMGELADGENNNDMDEIKDAIGDVLVCLINYSALRDYSLSAMLPAAFQHVGANLHSLHLSNSPVLKLLRLFGSIGRLADDEIKGDLPKLEQAIVSVLANLVVYCDSHSVTLEGCLAAAYAVIKDRKGSMLPNGVFVKD